MKIHIKLLKGSKTVMFKGKKGIQKNKLTNIQFSRSILKEIAISYLFCYNQYLIAWDILNSDYTQIASDLKRNKINQNDIIKIVNYIDKYYPGVIKNYWKGILLKVS